MDKCGQAKAKSRRKPMSNLQLTSIKAVFEAFRAGMNFKVPVIPFWARVHCLECHTSLNRLLPLSYQPIFKEKVDDDQVDEVIGLEEVNDHAKIPCNVCKKESGVILWFEDHTVLDDDFKPDWFNIAQSLSDKINALYSISASIDEIKPLESRLHHIEVVHIKIDADQLLWGEHDEIDQRFC